MTTAPRMIRALLDCGSLQRASANRAALDAARTALLAKGVQVSVFDALASIPPMNPDHADLSRPFHAEYLARLALLRGAEDGDLRHSRGLGPE